MKLNYTWCSVLCLLLSIPLAWQLLQRQSSREQGPALRVATFHAGWSRSKPGELLDELRAGDSAIAKALAWQLQRLGIEVLLLTGVDADAEASLARLLVERYFGQGQDGEPPLRFPFWHSLPAVAAPGAAAAGGMILFSMLPIEQSAIRSFTGLAWQRMPDAMVANDSAAAGRLAFASSHAVPIQVTAAGDRWILLCSQAGEPTADPDSLGSRRNHDQLRFWVDYLSPAAAAWIEDDAGGRGGLDPAAAAVLLGRLQVDPFDGPGQQAAIAALLQHGRLQDPKPGSAGGVRQQQLQWGSNARHRGDPALDTADLDDSLAAGLGNLRLDYVLPTRNLRVRRSGVLWPVPEDPAAPRVALSPHRLVWVDLALPR